MTILCCCLLLASWTASGNVQLHQSMMSSDHLLGGLPTGRSPSTIPSITVFTNRWSFIRQMWPNNLFFRCFIRSTTLWCLSTVSLIVLLLLYLSNTLSISACNTSSRMPGAFESLPLWWSMSQLHRADEKIRRILEGQSWFSQSARCYSTMSSTFPFFGLPG